MSRINKAAVLNPLPGITNKNILDYIPRATTTEFGVVAIGSGINVDELGRIYLDTQEYSDRLTAIEAQAASTLATQKSEVAAAIAQVNLAQSQTITALTLEVSNLKTDLITSATATQTELTNRIGQLTQDVTDSIEAKQTEFSNRTNQIVQEVNDSITTIQTNFNNQTDQLIQDVTDITEQLTQDKEAFTQEIQDALVYLEQAESVASALRTPRKINGTDFDGRSDITTNAWGATRTFKIGNKTNSIDGTSNVDYSLADIGAFPEVGGTIQGNVEVTGNLSVGGTISATLEGTAASAARLQTPRTINGVSFDGSADITLPLASTSVSGTVQLNNTLTSTATTQALTAAQGKVLNDNKLDKTENAVSASKLQTSRIISLTGGVTGSVNFDGSANASIDTTVTGLGVANGIATLDANGQVPSTQLPSYVDDVLEYLNVAAFPSTGVAGKIYVETTGNTTYRWSGTGYVKITSGEVSSVAGKTGVVTLTKADVGLANVDNTADSTKSVASAAKLTTARTINGTSFDGTANITITDDTKLPLTGGTVEGSLSVSDTITVTGVGEHANAFKKLIQAATTTTDGGYIAVGNNGENRGYIEIGTTDDSDEEIYATQRGLTNNTVVRRAKLLDMYGNTSFPGTVTAPTFSGVLSGNAATATQLATARTINGIAFDGSTNITVADSTKLPLTGGTVTGSLDINNDNSALRFGNNFDIGFVKQNGATGKMIVGSTNSFEILQSTGTAIPSTISAATTQTFPSLLTLTPAGVLSTKAGFSGNIAGNASSATKLATARTINGVSFDGTANITIADNTKLSLTGGTISGQLVAPNIQINRNSSVASGISWYSSSYDSWQDYMAPAGSTGNGVNGNITAPTGTYVTTWARRSVIEPAPGYGWTFETMPMNVTAPSIVAELSVNGTFKTAGDIHGANLNASGSIRTNGVVYASEVNTQGVRTSNFYSGTAFSFYGPDSSTSQRIKCNSILASHAWADEPYVPERGIFARGDISSAGNISAWGNVTAYSDKRIKEGVTVIDNALNKVEQLNGVTFKRKDTLDRQTGLLAQEVEAVLPEAVTRQKASEEIKAIIGDEEVLAVNYGALVGLLVESIKELKAEIDVLKGKVK